MIPVVFINCKKHPFVDDIISKRKRFETRNRNTLGPVIRERVLIAETGKGKPLVKCSAFLYYSVVARSADEWEHYRKHTAIPKGSDYDWKPGTQEKYLYRLTDVIPVNPFRLPDSCKRHGRIWAEYEGI